MTTDVPSSSANRMTNIVAPTNSSWRHRLPASLHCASGNTCEQADAAARAVIEEGGYGHAFRHRLGHGIGIDVHEAPFLTAGDTTELVPGMCFTAEPSIFLPRHMGARVEDVVVVREQGGEPLTGGYKELHVVE